MAEDQFKRQGDVAAARRSPVEVFFAFLRLGLVSFGGPVAHLGYLRNEFVVRRRWLDDKTYADLIALCQLLPGPSSSQVGMALGLLRGGLAGLFAAWIGFTAPSALAMILFGYGVDAYGGLAGTGFVHGLKLVAVAVVAQAVWSMERTLAPDRPRMSLAVAAALSTLAWPGSLGQIGAILAGAAIGAKFFTAEQSEQSHAMALPIGHRAAVVMLAIFFLLLAGLPILARLSGNHSLALVDGFYRAGALVFGGGHVVLPLLQSAVVPQGWLSNNIFLAGYGAAQAVPGPLFAFSAYLGTVLGPTPNGWQGGLLCLAAIYLPSFLLVLGALPFWEYARRHATVRAALVGVNAAVVGLLLAALYQPVWTSAVETPTDFGLALAAFLLLVFWRFPPWLVALLAAAAGALRAAL